MATLPAWSLAVSDSPQAQVTVTYTITTSVEDARLDFFTLAGLGSRFYTPNNLRSGDRVTVNIRKLPDDNHIQSSTAGPSEGSSGGSGAELRESRE